MYGCVFFIGAAAFFLTRPDAMVGWQEKAVFSCFFLGAIACLGEEVGVFLKLQGLFKNSQEVYEILKLTHYITGMSFAFHTLACHSPGVGRLFSKLDYSGISLLIIGSFIPWLYYSFYCRTLPKLIYISMIVLLGRAYRVIPPLPLYH